jgi:hypothetical protein
MVEIVEGLAAGDSVIVAGSHMVRDGGEIRILDAPTLDEPTTGATRPGTNGDTTTAGGAR